MSEHSLGSPGTGLPGCSPDPPDAEADAVPADRPPGAAAVDDGLYRLLVESVRDYAIFALDRTGHIITWNPGAERFKGYRAGEIIGRHFSVFYPPEDLATRKPWWELEVAEREGRFEDEGWRLRKDGSRFWANVVITALRGQTGELVGFAKVTRDLTDRRMAAEALRRSEERFRLLVQSVRDYGIFMLDPQGLVSSWNEGAEHINGYTAREILGQHFSVFYPREDREAHKPEHELEVAERVGRFEDEGWRVRKNGARFWSNVVITALRGEGDELVGFAKVTRDLTERRAAELRALENARRLAAEETARTLAEERSQELAALNERLRLQAAELEQRRREAEEANRVKSEFLAAMSHELRTPLNAIAGYSELLSMGIHGPLTPGQEAALERIRLSQQHLLGQINDILNFSRLEAGAVTYTPGPVAVRGAVQNAAHLVSVSAQSRGVELEVEGGEDAVAFADGPKVEQILLNLLTNAIKFTDPGGRITLTCAAEGAQVRIRVRDTGIGIPPDQLEAVFEPFVQVGRSLTQPSEGTGLGLAISRELARAMGGDLAAESVEGKGSVFTLTLPRAPAEKDGGRGEPARESLPGGGPSASASAG
jgi:PAS domain S-box-containing protein